MIYRIALTLLSCSFSTILFAQTGQIGSDENTSEALLVEPKIISRGKINYPYQMRIKEHSGMVELRMMVDKDGRPYSPVVTSSSNVNFNEAAKQAVLNYKFTPASYKGSPVDSHFQLRITFLISGSQDSFSSERFSAAFRTVRKELNKEKPNKKKIDKRLTWMANAFRLNEYSIAYLALAKSRYASKFSDENEELLALRELRMYDDRATESGSLLGNETIGSVNARIIQLELKLGHYLEALYGHKELQKSHPDLASKFSSAISEAENILRSSKAFARRVDLSERGNQHLNLLATKFAIDEVEGSISNLIFRCERGYAELEFQHSSEYEVPEKWGLCWLDISGEPQTIARLVHLRDQSNR